MPSLLQAFPLVARQNTNAETPGSAENDRETGEDTLPGGAIAGIVIGILAGLGIIVFVSMLLAKRRRRKQIADTEAAQQKQMSLDARSSVGTRPSNVGGHHDVARADAGVVADEPRVDDTTQVQDHVAGEEMRATEPAVADDSTRRV